MPTQEVHSPVLTADLFPTVLDMAGTALPDEIDGVSLMPQIASGQAVERIVCGEFGRPGNAMAFATDGHWKYIYYVQGGVEHLFDMATDPDNLHNLVHDATYAGETTRLKQELIAYLARHDRPLVVDGRLMIVTTVHRSRRTSRAQSLGLARSHALWPGLRRRLVSDHDHYGS